MNKLRDEEAEEERGNWQRGKGQKRGRKAGLDKEKREKVEE